MEEGIDSADEPTLEYVGGEGALARSSVPSSYGAGSHDRENAPANAFHDLAFGVAAPPAAPRSPSSFQTAGSAWGGRERVGYQQQKEDRGDEEPLPDF